jgi:inner membrane protein
MQRMGLLDACTNYGTHLLWPFSPVRVAWHWITTIGPWLTLILLVGLVFAVRRRSRGPALLALLLGLGYVGLAAWQRERALRRAGADRRRPRASGSARRDVSDSR